uniref:Uncharacterized protein n=1 Tax=Leptospirillum ferrodiazotrophum TaxID=412449 RepID=C6HZM5_9BACT|nr:MAG: hypothetical protein UBAL3_95390021 [Leptospirillum ferrodiazotrophum]
MTNRYKTKNEREGHKRRVKAYRERLSGQGLKPRQIWMTDQENDRVRNILAHWRGEPNELTDKQREDADSIRPEDRRDSQTDKSNERP